MTAQSGELWVADICSGVEICLGSNDQTLVLKFIGMPLVRTECETHCVNVAGFSESGVPG